MAFLPKFICELLKFKHPKIKQFRRMLELSPFKVFIKKLKKLIKHPFEIRAKSTNFELNKNN